MKLKVLFLSLISIIICSTEALVNSTESTEKFSNLTESISNMSSENEKCK